MKLAYLLFVVVAALAIALEAWVPFHPLATFLIILSIATVSFLLKREAQ